MEYLKGSRIFFGPCGIGLGHVSRNIPIAKELEKKGATVVFSTYLESIGYARRNGFKVIEAPPLSLISDESGSIDLKSSIKQILKSLPVFGEQVKTELKYMKSFKPDIVVSDSRLSTVFASKILGKPIILILNQFNPLIPRKKDRLMAFRLADGTIMTLLGKGWSLCDEILIPDFPEPYTLSSYTLRIPKRYRRKISLIGAILPKKPEENKLLNEINKEFNIKKGQKLIYAGISGPKQERIPLINLLESTLNNFSDDYKFILSTGDPSKTSEKTIDGSLIKIPWIEDRFEYLNACDAIISRGGHETLMQSICYGKPSIIIPVPNHPEQYGNARRAQKLGVAKAIHQNKVSSLKLKLLLDEITEQNRYKENLINLNKIGHVGDGLEKSIEVISKYLKK